MTAPWERSVEDEILDLRMGAPHVLLLGAGASKAALPNGDRNGQKVPLLREVAHELNLARFFPAELQQLARSDFESAYSRLVARRGENVPIVQSEVARYFEQLQLPEEANLYDLLNLCLREKDAIFTFNWDPFLIQSRSRLAMLGVPVHLPKVFFLHGNVKVGFCRKDDNSGLLGRSCSYCHQPFEASPLLFPVEEKNYQDGALVEREWKALAHYLKHCFMFTIFGYSAPQTDVEALRLLKEAWGEVGDRQLEQTEIIDHPGCDEVALRARWQPFIHTHHYDVFDSFYESWIANHPRRTGEAYWAQYLDAQFIDSEVGSCNYRRRLAR